MGGGRKVNFPEKWPCCSGTYIQAIADYQNLIYFHQPNALLVNLCVPSAVSWTHAGNEVELTQGTAYPKSDSTSITVRARAPDTFALKLRTALAAPQVSPAGMARRRRA